MKHSRTARGFRLLFGAGMLVASSLGGCGNDVGDPPEPLAPKPGDGGTTSTAGTQSSGGNNVATPGGGANGDAAGAGGEESMAGAQGNSAGTTGTGGHGGGSGGVAGMAGSGGMAGTASGGGAGSGGAGMAGSANTAGTAGSGGSAGSAGSGGSAGSVAICGDGKVVGDECEDVSTPLCSDDCRKVATQACVDCELLSPCAELSNNCVDWTGSPADQAICYDVQACVRTTGCGNGASSFTSCFCGTLSTQMCQAAPDSGAGAPSGLCAPIIRQAMLAAGETSVTNQQVLQRLLDVAYPGGAAISRWNCDKVKCQTECGFQ